MTRHQHAMMNRVEVHLAQLGSQALSGIVHDYMQDQMRQRGFNPGFESKLAELIAVPIPATGQEVPS